MSNNSKKIDECNSLIDLLEQYEVRIPIIQRDYAQGRKNNKASVVRKRLIEDLLSCLNNEVKSIDFNFIYGNVENDIFYPVDGQQRLTSLYLLHWVLACRSGKIDEFDYLKPFTYATRNSANEFFRLLKNPNEELIELTKCNNFEKNIKNYPWYLSEWNQDPTVQSSLVFINELCKKMDNKYDCKKMYEMLINSNTVTFHLFEENSGGNTESAAAIKYIRMNARGKELTTFENIKAMLDSIIQKNTINSNIIDYYDKNYIDIFYSMAKLKHTSSDSTKINEVNCFIDSTSLIFFKNIHSISRIIFKKNSKKYEDFEYLNELYEDSQTNSIELKFYTFYFDLINKILHNCHNEEIRKLLDSLFKANFCVIENRVEIALVLYIYNFVSGEHNIGQSMKILKYILLNLNYDKWKEDNYSVTSEFIKQVASVECPMSFFANTSENIFEISKITDVLEDIKIRIKEQHIKANIIQHIQKDYNFFDKLEIQSKERKIQYILYISGLWQWNIQNITHENIVNLKRYMEISNTYFHVNDIEWRKRFLVAGCSDDNGLLSSENINKIDWQNRCEWNDKYYFWDDLNDSNYSIASNSIKLNILKLAYDNEDIKYSNRVEMLNNIDYSGCWLRYAINRDYQELLDNKIFFNHTSNRVYIKKPVKNYKNYYVSKSFEDRDFMSEVLCLDHIKEQGYSEKDIYLDPTKDDLSCRYREFIIEKSSNHKVTLYSNNEYKHSTKPYSFSDWRNYNLTLEGISKINIIKVSDNITFSSFDGIKKELTLYSPKDGNQFTKYIYDLSIVINSLTGDINSFNNRYTQIDYDTILEILHGDADSDWIHAGGNNRSWYIKIIHDLNKFDESTISIS